MSLNCLPISISPIPTRHALNQTHSLTHYIIYITHILRQTLLQWIRLAWVHVSWNCLSISNCVSFPHAHLKPTLPQGWSSGTPFDKSHPTGFQYTTDKNASKKKTINLDGAWNLVVSLGLLTEGRHYRPSRIKPGKLLNYVLVVPPQLFSSFDRPLKFKRTVKKHTGIADEKEIKKQQVKDEEIDEKKIIILKQLIKQYVVTCANLDSGLH